MLDPMIRALSLCTLLAVVANCRALPGGDETTLRYCLAPQAVPPYVDPVGFKGLTERLAAEAGQRVGFRIEFVVMPRARCRALLGQGAVDVMAVAPAPENLAVAEFPQRDGHIDMSRALVVMNLAMVRRRGDPFRWDGRRFVGAQPSVIGVRRGAPVVRQALQVVAIPIDEAANDSQHTLAKLERGRVDVVIGIKAELELVLAESGSARLELVEPTPPQQIIGFAAVSRSFYGRHRERVEAWWREIGALRGRPEYAVKAR